MLAKRWKDYILQVKEKKGFYPTMVKDKRKQMISRNMKILLSQGRALQ